MLVRGFRAGLIVSILLVSGCITPARMEMPRFPVSVEATRVTGLGMGTSGSFQAGALAGHFSRSESRLGLFDPLFVSNRGGSRFTVMGPEFPGRVDAECGMIRNSVGLAGVSIDVSRLIYRCAFLLDGMPMDADFILRDSSSGWQTVEERRGEVIVGGTRLAVLSSNRVQGSSLPTDAPIGYVMEWGGAPVGAVELNGTVPTMFLPLGLPEEVRQAVLLAGLALSVFWDPANSGLGH